MPGQFYNVIHNPYVTLHRRFRASKEEVPYNFNPIPLPNDSCSPIGINVKSVTKVLGTMSDSHTSYIASVTIVQRAVPQI